MFSLKKEQILVSFRKKTGGLRFLKKTGFSKPWLRPLYYCFFALYVLRLIRPILSIQPVHGACNAM